jgi:hypothetical protein
VSEYLKRLAARLDPSNSMMATRYLPRLTLGPRYCKGPRLGALEDAGSREEFDAINLAMDACGMPDAEGYDNGCCTASRHWGIELVAPHEIPCTPPRQGVCRPRMWRGVCGPYMPWSSCVQPNTRPTASPCASCNACSNSARS